MKNFKDFLPEFYNSVLPSCDVDLYNPHLLRLAATRFCGELFISLPQTGVPLSRQQDLSDYMEKLGFSKIVPSFVQVNDKVVESGSLLMYHGDLDILAVRYQGSGSFQISCKASSLTKAIGVCESIHQKFSEENNEGKISNIIRLDIDKRQESFFEYQYDPIDAQDDTIIRTYEWNDDVIEAIKLNRPGLLIFHGEPGTGKSSYIRWLAQMNPDREFALLSMITLIQEGGIRYLTRYLTRKYSASVRATSEEKPKNMVIVLEDSERILQPRETSPSSSIITSELLNLIDGAGPERDRVKFIFTFNMKVSKVDTAILRKGRLLKSIEFKKLTGNTLAGIASKFGVTLSDHEKKTGLSVADLVYHDEDTGIKSRESIGFK